ncbi:BlaI/MecI/CopY family transcriptional regulator [Ruminococcaceae bacterium OttesenSCG-928-D13]|nr:BlaI/MecI/CopY family transcriptional regulator [Ruminococcaceae bacterium OttesenSCG-928-D13]
MPENRLSESELYIMRAFWAHGGMGTDELGALVATRGWKPTTLLTFLSRLAAKGMLAVEKRGKSNWYSPLVSREEYGRGEGRAFLDELYGGSARDFLAAMVEGRALSADEVAELRAWLNAREVNTDD